MHDTVLLTSDGQEIYQSEIDILTDEYISTLPDPSAIYSKSTAFSGLLLYIYKHLIKGIIDKDKAYRNSPNTNNYKLLDSIFFEIYIPLCYRYDIEPTIIQFCFFVRISKEVLTDINNGFYRTDKSRVKPDTSLTVKKWYLTCEESSLSGAKKHGKIGDIFDLKANYSYVESPQRVEIIGNANIQSVDQIKERYKSAQLPILDNE